MIRVLVADDSEDIRQVMKALLDGEDGFNCVDCVDSVEQVVPRAMETEAHVVLLDYRLPGGGAFVAMEQLVAQAPQIKVILHTGFSDPNLIEEAKRRGAAFLTKGSDIEVMFQKIREVAGQK